MNGSVIYAVEISNAATSRLLNAYIAKQYPNALNVGASIGSLSAANITLPGAALRSSAIELMGSGLGSVPIVGLLKCIGEFLKAVVPGGFQVATRTARLADVEKFWDVDTGTPRLVFLVG